MANIYLGQWEWFTPRGDPENDTWRAPGGDGIVGFDLRSLPKMSLAGGSPQGGGMFVYDGPRSHPELTLDLGSDVERNLTLVEKSGLATMLGRPDGVIRTDKLWEAFNEMFLSDDIYDPTGQTALKPRRGALHRPFHFDIDGIGRIQSERFTQAHPAYQATIEVFQADYRRNRAHVDRGELTFEILRKYTGSMMRRLTGRMGDDLVAGLVPPEFERDKWEVPTTIIGDTFVEGSDTELSLHTATGANGGHSWAKADGADTDVIASIDRARQDTGTSVYRAETALASDDHYTQAECFWSNTTSPTELELLARKDATLATLTWYSLQDDVDGTTLKLRKRVAGSGTDLSTKSFTGASGELLRVECGSDDVIRGDVDGTEELTKTAETSITGNLYTGIRPRKEGGATADMDNYEASDLAAAIGVDEIMATIRPTSQPILQPTSVVPY